MRSRSLLSLAAPGVMSIPPPRGVSGDDDEVERVEAVDAVDGMRGLLHRVHRYIHTYMGEEMSKGS